MVRDTVAMDTRAIFATALMSMRAGFDAEADPFFSFRVAMAVPSSAVEKSFSHNMRLGCLEWQ
jgi:hypothetical protein